MVNAEEAEQIRKLYAGYISGQSYMDAAKNAGLKMAHASTKRLLQNIHYLGDDFYPAIVDRETYEAAERERLRRLEIMGRDPKKKPAAKERKVSCRFVLGPITENRQDPFEQAAYIYTLIESEE